jgi:hypothetical protein
MFAELIACAVTLAASPGTTLPGTAVIGQTEVPWPIGGGMMDFGVKTTSDSYTDGHFSITAPVFSSMGQDGTLGGSLVFIEPYISWGEQGEVATSLGLGFRHLFNQQPLSALQEQHTGLLDEGAMVGGNLFLDMLDTQSDNRFWQLGFGLEFETRYFALRGNYYHPLTDRQENEPILQRDIQRAIFLTSGEEPFATGHTIQQDLTFTTYDFYTDRLYRTYEEGMKGWDVEAAVMVPWLDKWCELWLIGGYGDFQNQPFGPQIGGTGELQGWKAGIEFRPIPQLVLSATHYEEKRMAGGEWLYGLSLQVPLDPEPHNPGKSWWRKIKDTLKPRSRHLAERAAVPVHRQNAAVKVANSVSEPEVTQYAKVVSEEEKRVVVRDDVIFVNNGGAQGNGIAAHGVVEDGTAERPFDGIQEGIDLSATGWYQARGLPTVYVTSLPPSDNGLSVTVTHSLRLVSAGYGIAAFAQQRFGRGLRCPLPEGIDAHLLGDAHLEIDGFEIGGISVAMEHADGSPNFDGYGFLLMRANVVDASVGQGSKGTAMINGVANVALIGNIFRDPTHRAGDVSITGPNTGSVLLANNDSEVLLSASGFRQATAIGNKVTAYHGGIWLTATERITIRSNYIRVWADPPFRWCFGIDLGAGSTRTVSASVSDNVVIVDSLGSAADTVGIVIAGHMIFDNSDRNLVYAAGQPFTSAALRVYKYSSGTAWFGGDLRINAALIQFGSPASGNVGHVDWVLPALFRSEFP